jgi:formate hydrogenlyase subunit 6/NADH:ubiquinone oxidoreductase subunit I/flavodoxin
MEISKVKLVYYSPTNTSKRTGRAIVQGTGLDYDYIDLTLPDADSKNYEIAADELVIISAPVYSGRIPSIAVNRLKKLKGTGTPVVIVSVYGNRAFDDALLELLDITKKLGFKAVAGAAFIGQHSFDTKDTPIATGRPDAEDIKKAMEFGAKVMEKLSGLDEVPDLSVPGNHPYRKGGGGNIRSPETNPETCILCGLCARMCPSDCVEVTDSVSTEKARCTACSACVQNCPTGARHWEHEGILKSAKRLSNEHGERKEPEIFI